MDFKTREVRTVQGPKKPLRERETYFRLMQQGLSDNQACRIVGINPKTGRRWRSGLLSGYERCAAFRRGRVTRAFPLARLRDGKIRGNQGKSGRVADLDGRLPGLGRLVLAEMTRGRVVQAAPDATSPGRDRHHRGEPLQHGLVLGVRIKAPAQRGPRLVLGLFQGFRVRGERLAAVLVGGPQRGCRLREAGQNLLNLLKSWRAVALHAQADAVGSHLPEAVGVLLGVLRLAQQPRGRSPARRARRSVRWPRHAQPQTAHPLHPTPAAPLPQGRDPPSTPDLPQEQPARPARARDRRSYGTPRADLPARSAPADLTSRFTGVDPTRLPRRFPALPTRITLGELCLPEPPPSPTWIPLGLGGPDHGTVGIDLIEGAHLLLLSGPPGSGRTTATAALAHSLRRAGIGVLALAPPRSPLPALLPDDPGVRVLTGVSHKDADLREAAEAFGDGPFALLLDDADHITVLPTQQGFADASTLLDEIARLSARGRRALVLSADATPVPTGFPGPPARLINTVVATGHRLLLAPAGRTTAAAHGITLEPDQYFTAPPGRGYLTAGGRTPVLVQLALPGDTHGAGTGRGRTHS